MKAYLNLLPRAMRKRDLMLGIIAIDEVLHHAPALEDTDLLAYIADPQSAQYPNMCVRRRKASAETRRQRTILERISQRRDPAIRVDLKKPRFLLRVLGELDVRCLVGETVDEGISTCLPPPL